ncbi:uncharacterized protein BDR25DRAFT_353129 [Lindgomyces ingoldianus]|uniref:Uncharacterized protein n=1 Tax=Lindgomyces ingoldianus TaxID=673940 RepID=A0ACB6R3A6_9PLEO|nr:uncharacterized protein BDR25DRAFT_353129 [Lindgomyces ingoldianus]KAF2472807.1 hypothetical protein BDR25DRAFT_353129 [Lindgomyces ingoldianus]
MALTHGSHDSRLLTQWTHLHSFNHYTRPKVLARISKTCYKPENFNRDDDADQDVKDAAVQSFIKGLTTSAGHLPYYLTPEYPGLGTGYIGSSASVPLPLTLRFTLVTPTILHFFSVPRGGPGILIFGAFPESSGFPLAWQCFSRIMHFVFDLQHGRFLGFVKTHTKKFVSMQAEMNVTIAPIAHLERPFHACGRALKTEFTWDRNVGHCRGSLLLREGEEKNKSRDDIVRNDEKGRGSAITEHLPHSINRQSRPVAARLTSCSEGCIRIYLRLIDSQLPNRNRIIKAHCAEFHIAVSRDNETRSCSILNVLRFNECHRCEYDMSKALLKRLTKEHRIKYSQSSQNQFGP